LETQFQPRRTVQEAIDEGSPLAAQAAVDGLKRFGMHPGSGRNVQDLVGREDSSAAQAEDAKFETSRGFIIDPVVDAGVGATRRRKDDTAGELKIRGNPEIHPRHR